MTHFDLTVRKQGDGFAEREDWATESVGWERGGLQWCDEEVQSSGPAGHTGPDPDLPAVPADRGSVFWPRTAQTGGKDAGN